jgi:hypothetical protein
MEEHQEEIEIVEHLYFKARAFVKYRADRHNYLSEEKGFDHFSIDIFYDLKIGDSKSNSVQKITQSTYLKNIEKCIQIDKIEGSSELWKDGVCYQFAPDAIYFQPTDPNHNQVESDNLHGYFNDLVVYFKTQRIKKLIVCKEGFPTGNTKVDDEGFVHTERYCRDCSTVWHKKTCVQGAPTGKRETRAGKNFIEYYNSNCTTYWIEIKTTCIQDSPTGNSEYRDNIKFLEYYNADCSTYWKPVCEQDKATGKTKIVDGIKWAEYYNEDCTTYWKKISQPPVPRPEGCWDIVKVFFQILAFIYMAAPFVFLIVTFFLLKLWIPLLFIIGIILLGRLVIFFIDSSSKYPRVTRFVGGIFQLIFTLFILGLLGFGIANLFDGKEPGSSKTRWENVTPSPKPIIETEYPVFEDGSETSAVSDTIIKVFVEWEDFRGNTYEGSYTLKTSDIRISEQKLSAIPIYPNNHFGRVYRQLYDNDKDGLNSLYGMLDSIQKSNELTRVEFAEAIVTMIQSQEYVLVLEIGCSSPMAYNDREIQAMIRAGIACDGEHPYGIKTPLKFASDLMGDCDTRTVLLYTILRHFNYDVAILNSEFYKHSILGLNLSNQKGSFKLYQGKKYYFWETTSKGFKLGELPRENGNINFWNVVLN